MKTALAAWRERMAWTANEAHQNLGLSRNSLAKYEREGGTPLYVLLACAALEAKLDPVQGSDTVGMDADQEG